MNILNIFRKKKNKTSKRADRSTDLYPTPEAFKIEQERIRGFMNRWFR